MAGEKSKRAGDSMKDNSKATDSMKENRLGKLSTPKVISAAPENDSSSSSTLDPSKKSLLTSSEQIEDAVKKAGKAIENSPRSTNKNQKNTVAFDDQYDLLQISSRDPTRAPAKPKIENLLTEDENEKPTPEKPSTNPSDKK